MASSYRAVSPGKRMTPPIADAQGYRLQPYPTSSMIPFWPDVQVSRPFLTMIHLRLRLRCRTGLMRYGSLVDAPSRLSLIGMLALPVHGRLPQPVMQKLHHQIIPLNTEGSMSQGSRNPEAELRYEGSVGAGTDPHTSSCLASAWIP